MPKATKKAKDKKADFVKAKFKLGKGKKAANNATNTSFKARSIALPSQNPLARALAAEDDDSDSAGRPPVTAKGLTLDEVLIQLRHPNAGARREALGGVQEVLTVGASRGIPHGSRDGETAKVLRAVGAIIADDDGSVRKAVIVFFSWYFALLPRAALDPYLPLLQLQLSSALSHIFPEIRIDACRLVSVLLDTVPSAMVGSWPQSAARAASTDAAPLSGAVSGSRDGGSTIFEGLRLAVGLGAEGAPNASGFRIDAAAKLVVLSTIFAFVQHAVDPPLRDDVSGKQPAGPQWTSGLLGGRRARQAPTYAWEDLQASAVRPGWLYSHDDPSVSPTTLELGNLGHTADQAENGDLDIYLANLYNKLHPLLVATFLEAAPTAFAPSATSATAATRDVPLHLCRVSATLVAVFAAAVLADPPAAPALTLPPIWLLRQNVADFLRRMAAYFPFSSPAAADAADATGLAPTFDLALAYAKICLLLAPRPPRPVIGAAVSREPAWRLKVKAVEAAWALARTPPKSTGGGRSDAAGWAMARVAEWVVEVLSPSDDALTPPLPSAAYAALLPIILSLLLHPPLDPTAAADDAVDIPSVVGEAFFAHLLRQPSNSAPRRLGNSFVCHFVGLHEARHPSVACLVPLRSPVRALVTAWLQTLPKVLWELGNKDEAAAGELMTFLLHAAQDGSDGSPYRLLDRSAFPGMAAKLSPYFHVTHPTKGAVAGPWARLRSDRARRLALDLAIAWSACDATSALRDAVGLAVQASSDSHSAAYWRARCLAPTA